MNRAYNIAIFASGGGSNAEAIIQHFSRTALANIALIVSNSSNAGVLTRAQNHELSVLVHTKEEAESGQLLEALKAHQIDFIVLAGYLKKIGDDLIEAFPNRIVNIHPALLPKFGGQGMYGMNVHKAVVDAGETETGPTIHYVNENYDEGAIIAQFKCPVHPEDTAEDVQKRVLTLEHEHYPQIIENIIQNL